jgi:hypothetical protein
MRLWRPVDVPHLGEARANDGRQTAGGHERERPGGETIIERYQSLADIERGFKVLKSEL